MNPAHVNPAHVNPAHMNPAQLPPPRLPALDGVRALSILAVVVFHVHPAWLPSGSLGVEVFFVISGFLITGLLVDELGRTRRLSLRAFYTRRFRRLTPALVLLIVAETVVLGLHGELTGAYAVDAAKAITYTDDLFLGYGGTRGPFALTWSLSIEEQFYLIWPAALLLIYLMLHRRGIALRRAMPWLVAAAIVVHVVMNHSLPDGWVPNFLPTSRVDALLGGGWLAVASRDPAQRRWLERWTGSTTAGLLALLALAGLMALPARDFLYDGLLLAIPPAGLLVAHAALAGEAGPVARLLASRPAVWVGRRSYSCYLLHLLVAGELLAIHQPSLRLAAVLVVSLAAADLSYRYVETPLRSHPQPSLIRSGRP